MNKSLKEIADEIKQDGKEELKNRKPKKQCEGGEVNRSPKTKKCMKACKTGYERSLTTNRCKKI